MSEKSKRGRPRDGTVDSAILSGALDLFIEGGLENVSYEQISQRSGVSRAAIYRRWVSRPQLLVAAIDFHARTTQEPLPDWHSMDFQNRLGWFILHMPRLVMSPFFRRLTGELLASSGGQSDLNFLFHETIERRQKLAFGRLMQAAIMEEVVEKGVPTDLIYDMVFGALIARTISNPNGATEDEARKYLVDLLATLGFQA